MLDASDVSAFQSIRETTPAFRYFDGGSGSNNEKFVSFKYGAHGRSERLSNEMVELFARVLGAFRLHSRAARKDALVCASCRRGKRKVEKKSAVITVRPGK